MVSSFVIYFSLMSVIGYFYESFAMTIWGGKWDNRGFLFGPAIPIYGAASLLGTILFEYFYTDYTPKSVFLIAVFSSAILEYVVHYTMEQIFHAYWWDYSKAPLNINGRICLPASLGFGIAGLIIVYIINPAVLPFIASLNTDLRDVIALICTILFTADFTVTISILSSFIRRVESMEEFVNDHMDALVGNVLDESKGLNNRFYSAVDRVETARKKLIDARIEKSISSMNIVYHTVLSHIKGFRGKSYERFNGILERIRNRINRE